MRVLVVEDEVKMAALLRRGLSEEGLTVDIAEEGERALLMAGASEYDAVVLDVMLPGIDGIEVMERLQERPGPPIAVILLTARGEDIDAERRIRPIRKLDPSHDLARTRSVDKAANGTIASRRLRNSGVNIRLIASSSALGS